MDDDDKLYSEFQEAVEFMAKVRGEQAASGKPLHGPRQLSAERRRLVAEIAGESHLVAGVSEALDADGTLTELFERFEEMCRRRQMEIPSERRGAILKLLACELASNTLVLQMKPHDAMPGTCYRGAIAKDLLSAGQASRFKESMSTLQHAMEHNPTDPQSALLGIQSRTAEIADNPEFAAFLGMPSVLQRVALKNRSDATGAMQKLKETVEKLGKEKEFAEFSDSPSIVVHAVMNNPKSARALLRRIKATKAELMQDPNFADFRDTPGVLLRVAMADDPQSALRTIRESVAEVMKEDEFRTFHKSPGFLRYVAATRPGKLKEVLRRTLRIEAELMRDEELAEFRDQPSILRHVAVGNPEDAKRALQKAKEAVDLFLADDQFSALRSSRNMALVAVLHRPRDPKGALQKLLTGGEATFTSRALDARIEVDGIDLS